MFGKLPANVRITFEIDNYREMSLFLNGLSSFDWRIIEENDDLIEMERVGFDSLSLCDILSEIATAWDNTLTNNKPSG